VSARDESAELAAVVARKGALPMPIAPEPSELERMRLRVDEVERAYTFDTADLKRRIAELEQALRADQERFETVRSLCDAADHVGIVSGGWFTVEAVRKAAGLAGPDAVTRVFAPVASLREPEGEFYPFLHHANKTPHDLPETGGTQC
jgi:hypothetical protein